MTCCVCVYDKDIGNKTVAAGLFLNTLFTMLIAANTDSKEISRYIADSDKFLCVRRISLEFSRTN